MQTILLADDDKDELKLVKEILEKGGYRVKPATTPDEAMELLQPKKVRAAIIDFRLDGGGIEDDSGLSVAKESSREIPKIMISRLADEKQIMATVGADVDGRPILVKFLPKQSIETDSKILLDAVKSAIATRAIWDRTERESVRGQLLADYVNARRFDLINTVVTFAVNLVFIGLLILTFFVAHSVTISIGIIVGEIAINLLFARRLEGSGRRAEMYHAEVLQAWSFEQLMKSADELDYIKPRNDAKMEVISAFSHRWNNPIKGLKSHHDSVQHQD